MASSGLENATWKDLVDMGVIKETVVTATVYNDVCEHQFELDFCGDTEEQVRTACAELARKTKEAGQ